MCRGSAARALYEAETLEQQTMHLHKCDHVFFYLGKKSGGVVRLTAKPRYLLLLHRGEKKSNTVTALVLGTPWFQVSSRKFLVLRAIYPFPLALPFDQNENWDSPYSHVNAQN